MLHRNYFLNRTLIVLWLMSLVATSLFPDEKGDSIMNKCHAAGKAKDMQGMAIMVIIDEAGKKNTRKINMYTQNNEKGTYNLFEFVYPADVKGTKFLTIGNKNGLDDQRLWLPELGKVRKIASTAKDGKFMGSDLTYYDMEDHDMDEYKYNYIKDEVLTIKKDKIKKKQDCWVVESIPASKNAPYSRTEVWISKEDYSVCRTDFWNKKKNKEKSIFILEMETIGDIVVPVKTYVESVSGHKTLLQIKDIKINNGIDQALFTINYLKK